MADSKLKFTTLSESQRSQRPMPSSTALITHTRVRSCVVAGLWWNRASIGCGVVLKIDQKKEFSRFEPDIMHHESYLWCLV
jgi:hypothetical protein